jgi:uncharacterized membrane protein YcaP (DUF421 family)
VNILHDVLGEGVEAQHLTILQVSLRAVVVFFAALCIVRLASKRSFAKKTAFDLILGVILASMLGRAINGSEQLIPTICAGMVVALLHRGLAKLAFYSPRISHLVKGSTDTLIENGEVNRGVMEKHRIGDDDLMEDLRLSGVEYPKEVKLARLERSGDVSVIKKEE